jgi:hypothetical protein
MIPETLRLPKEIKATRAFGERALRLGMELVAVFLGPSDIVFVIVHGLFQ